LFGILAGQPSGAGLGSFELLFFGLKKRTAFSEFRWGQGILGQRGIKKDTI
jgi:hypothetical protein